MHTCGCAAQFDGPLRPPVTASQHLTNLHLLLLQKGVLGLLPMCSERLLLSSLTSPQASARGSQPG